MTTFFTRIKLIRNLAESTACSNVNCIRFGCIVYDGADSNSGLDMEYENTKFSQCMVFHILPAKWIWGIIFYLI